MEIRGTAQWGGTDSPFRIEGEVEAAEDFQMLSLQPLVLQLPGHQHTVLIVDNALTVQQHVSIQLAQRLGHHQLTYAKIQQMCHPLFPKLTPVAFQIAELQIEELYKLELDFTFVWFVLLANI